jgi:hypothetical protein
MRSVIALFFFALLAGCSAKTQSSPIPCEVDDVLARTCRSCHGATPSYGAPMPLVTWEDLQAPAKSDPAKKVFDLVRARIHDDAKPMPQPPAPRLSSSDMKIIDDWALAGAPSGNKTCVSVDAGNTTDSSVANAPCVPDVELAPAMPWQMPMVDDVYTCYGVDVPVEGSKQITAIKSRVDNTKIVHHIVLYQAPNSVPSTPMPCQAFGMTTWPFVYAWAPGIGDFELPKEAGFPMSGMMHYVVQVHYNNIGKLPNETDKSGFSLCTTKELRPNDADVVAFGSANFTIQPHSTLDLTCKYTLPPSLAGRKTFATFLHMHKLGKQISSVLTPTAGGPDIQLGDDPTYAFEAQEWAMLTPHKDMSSGDVITTRCVWNNNGDSSVRFGEDTDEEMCFAFQAYYPRANLLSWALPAYTSTCVKK